MKKIIEIRRDNYVYLYWLLTDYCNFECSYCCPTLHEGHYQKSKDFPSDVDIQLFLDSLRTYSKDKLLTVCLTGGEPTTHPMYATILSAVAEFPGSTLETITNGSRPLAWWKNLPTLPNKVIISLHQEFTNLEKINELALYLDSAGVDVRFNLVADPANWDWVTSVQSTLDTTLHQLIDAKILTRHNFDAGYTSGQLYEYAPEQLEFIKKTQSTKRKATPHLISRVTYDDGSIRGLRQFEVINNNQHQFKGWSCSAGRDGFKVTPNGTVWAGICQADNLGHIKDFKPNTDMLTCRVPYCKCPGDLAITKISPQL